MTWPTLYHCLVMQNFTYGFQYQGFTFLVWKIIGNGIGLQWHLAGSVSFMLIYIFSGS